MSQYEEDTGAANKLFVEAVKLVKSAERYKYYIKEHADALEEALRKLNEIVDDYPSSDLEDKLISGQDIGSISLQGVTNEEGMAREKVRVAETQKAAEQGDGEAQSNLGECYLLGHRVPEDRAEAIKWYLILR